MYDWYLILVSNVYVSHRQIIICLSLTFQVILCVFLFSSYHVERWIDNEEQDSEPSHLPRNDCRDPRNGCCHYSRKLHTLSFLSISSSSLIRNELIGTDILRSVFNLPPIHTTHSISAPCATCLAMVACSTCSLRRPTMSECTY